VSFVATPGQTYTLAVSAVDIFGLESDLSDSITYTEPGIPPVLVAPTVGYRRVAPPASPVVYWAYDSRFCDTLEWSPDLVTWTPIAASFYTIKDSLVQVSVSTARPVRVFRVRRGFCP
jgi:hypothetical protein